ncbi:hypothetical protein BG74_04640 [Sodalis-like endosymbiont of Proechinophthirus fluctus]|nr:hypothetical protein BG74_04640 [Sodalis-like endosymbiont of Proechinophthirus fluctus]
MPKILISVVTTLEELLFTQSQIEREKVVLHYGITFDDNISLIIIIEKSDTAIMEDVFSANCYFFIIRNNDLT